MPNLDSCKWVQQTGGICFETLLFQSRKDNRGCNYLSRQPVPAAIGLPIAGQQPFCGHNAGFVMALVFVALAVRQIVTKDAKRPAVPGASGEPQWLGSLCPVVWGWLSPKEPAGRRWHYLLAARGTGIVESSLLTASSVVRFICATTPGTVR